MLINTILFGVLPFLTYLIVKIRQVQTSQNVLGVRLYGETNKASRLTPIFLVIFIIIFFAFPFLNYIFWF